MPDAPKVLVIEPDADTRSTLAELLTDDGYAPVPVATSDQAIQHLKVDEPPCMVVLDLGARDDAVAFLQWLRGHDRLRDLHVAVTSGWQAPERRLANFGERVSRVIKKPFDVDELLTVIEQHCPRR
jgi:CheY-like chemotaxis protein